MNRILILLTVIMMVVACKPNTETDTTSADAETPNLEEKIAQMLIVGFRGTELTDDNHIKADIVDRNIGGVIYYHVDIPSKRTMPKNFISKKQVTQLSKDLQALSETPLFISIDQEGGRVNRLQEEFGFPKFNVSAQHLGALDNDDSTAYWGDLIASSLAEIGVNMNFAPVLDVNVNPDCPVIGGLERSFSADPKMVAKHGGIIVDNHRKHGILTSFKHFPGHGSAKMDSHKGFTDVTETWSELELEPYRQLISEGKADMIMTAHVFHQALDSVPATLSENIITGVLRNKLGWEGVVISDDMQMGAIADNYGLEYALEHSINAGVDILILSNNSPKPYDPNIAKTAIETISKLVKDGKISAERIDVSYNRIMALKEKL